MELDDDEGGGGEGGAPAWMATFGDMMSLLLTFFVLLLSFANMDVVKFRDAMGSVQDALGVQHEHPGTFEGLTTSVVELSDRESTGQLEILDLPASASDSEGDTEAEKTLLLLLQDAIDNVGSEGSGISVDLDPRGVVLRIQGEVLFKPGSDVLEPESHPFLQRVSKIARAFSGQVSIEGHTDDIPIRSTQFPSNWHLSSARAIASLLYLTQEGAADPRKLSCSGFADMRPRVPNDSPPHRQQNRRLEFVFQTAQRAPLL